MNSLFVELAWLIPVLPLAGFLITGFFPKALKGNVAGILASAMVLFSFIISCGLFFQTSLPQTITYFDWINVGSLKIPISFLIDQVSCVMLLIVTGVGFLIHVYSIG